MKGSGYSSGGLTGYVARRFEDYERTNDVNHGRRNVKGRIEEKNLVIILEVV